MNDADLMTRALAQARQSLDEGAMPIGAVLAHQGEILAKAHWRGAKQELLDHPEHVVLMRADRAISFEARREATLYTTLEPCLMCMGTSMSSSSVGSSTRWAAPADGATNVTEHWRPILEHPTREGPYALPTITGGVGETEV